jgi:NAD(P)H-flavin reductase
MSFQAGRIPIKAYSIELLNRRRLSSKTVELELSRPSGFSYQPGQRIRFINDSGERDYSLLSTPDRPSLKLCVRSVETGHFSPLLEKADIGTRFQVTGPHGHFLFQPSPRPAVFVATGTGIAPFYAFCSAGAVPQALIHGVKRPQDLYYENEFRSRADNYIACVSREKNPLREGFHGRVSDYIDRHLEPKAYDFYLCGRREMIRDVILLVDDNFPGSYIFTEIFY